MRLQDRPTDPTATTAQEVRPPHRAPFHATANSPPSSNPSTITPNPLTTTAATPSQQPPTLPPPSGPSKTFTIDIPIPFDTEVTDAFETLRLTHASFIDALTPDMDSTSSDDADPAPYSDFPMPDAHHHPQDDTCWLAATTAASAPASVVSHASSLPLGASALSTPPSSVALAVAPAQAPKARTVNGSLALRPQFNLDSAAGLLATFRGVMLAHFPCVVLEDEDGGVGEMARERPFVLLAVLAAASSSRSLQGHSLYDEEFRKVLGFKFVAGGERSLELLQGLVIYVAWYVCFFFVLCLLGWWLWGLVWLEKGMKGVCFVLCREKKKRGHGRDAGWLTRPGSPSTSGPRTSRLSNTSAWPSTS